MSPPPRQDARTPDRKSSLWTLDVFRHLTGGRPTLENRSSSPAATTTSIQAAAFSIPENSVESLVVQAAHSDNGRSSVQPAEGKTGSGSPDMGPQEHLQNILFSGETIGGPPQLQKLLPQLMPDRPTATRIAACRDIGAIIDRYPVTNLLAVWSAARDLLESSKSGASDAAFFLLSCCVRSDRLSQSERKVFFNAIDHNLTERNLDLRFQVLSELIAKGKNIEGFGGPLIVLLGQLFLLCFKVVGLARRKDKKNKAQSAAKEEQCLAGLFRLTIDVVRFNPKLVQEQYFVFLLDQVTNICKSTTSESDIANSIDLIDALTTYAHVPASAARSCIALLSDIYRVIVPLRGQSWAALANMLKSHLGQRAVSVLIGIMSGKRDSHETTNNVRGAFYVLAELIRADGRDGLPKIRSSQFIFALKKSMSVDSQRHKRDVMNLFADILSDENLTNIILEEPDWSDLGDICVQCVSSLPSESSPLNDNESTTSSAPSKAVSEEALGSMSLCEATTVVIEKLNVLAPRLDIVQRSAVMDMFMELGSRMNDSAAASVISYLTDERLLYPSHDDWFENCNSLVDRILNDQYRSWHARVAAVQALRDVYSTIECLCPLETTNRFVDLLLGVLAKDRNAPVLAALSDLIVEISDSACDDLFDRIFASLKDTLVQRRPSVADASSNATAMASAVPIGSTNIDFGTPCNVVTRAIVRMFTRSINKSAPRAEALYDLLLVIAGSSTCDTDARISALKLLGRIRSDGNHAIMVISFSEAQSMAAVLCRTVDTVVKTRPTEALSQQRAAHSEEIVSGTEGRGTRSAPVSSTNVLASRQRPSRMSKPVPPLWLYPGPKGLPEEPPSTASHLLFSDPGFVEEDGMPRRVLKTALWIEVVISLLQKETDWEIYSYVVVHIGAQLANQSLFSDAIPQIQMLRSVLCEQIRGSSFHEPPGYTSLKKADVAVCIFHTLTMLVSYHSFFGRSEEDEMVRAFLLGIGSWDRTSKWCIHALFVCCLELPVSISRSLDTVLQKMSQIITQPHIAVHILEFLTSLSRLPEVYKNFREDEFKTIFGICFQYLKYVRDQQARAPHRSLPRPSARELRHSGGSRELNALALAQEGKPGPKSAADDLPQYVYALAFHVMTFWFMNLKLQDRPTYMPWIAKNLTYLDKDGNEHIEEQGLVTIDMMQRVAYSDRDDTKHDPSFATAADGEISQKTWIVGMSLLTIETAGRTGVTQITHRRPTSTKYSIYKPQLTEPPLHQVPLTTGIQADAFYTSAYVGVLPDDVFQEFYSPLDIHISLNAPVDRPVVLPETDASRRALNLFDFNSTVDNHRVGIIYIGEGQSTEKEILANVMGSSDYTNFLSGIGTLRRLKNADFNTQGLDRQYGTDGEFTYSWRDRCTEVVFNVTTMMPTDLKDDPNGIAKKRHIGNAFVNVVWNNSGKPFNFDTFPSAFNYIYIVITSQARASFVETRHNPNQAAPDQFYRVQLMMQQGFPEISPAAETKIVSGKVLPEYVRLIALNASAFSLVWQNREGGEHVSPWRNRWRSIKKLRDQHCPSVNTSLQNSAHASPTPPGTAQAVSGASGRPTPRDSGAAFKRVSNATYMSDETNRSSVLSSAFEDLSRERSN
ncbi:hypothetical protein K402DRAFT_369899 [Aulographum hederae CBS 113979]|uniref:Rap-GAP domain-containing protein n=1 Tax=Aulographum hederae CBS 113979 TaxID=1176131 RepID=A0A6G1HCV7_9PEZI|nr:hypothetical protein K402DRAFT_369899 [Aulographum hederae CBS 113979]